MTTFNHNQQRSAQGRAGEARRAAVHPAHICVDHDNNWSASCRAGLELSRQTGGVRGPAFSHSHLPGATLHSTRQRRSVLPSLERGATFISRCRLARGPQFRFSQHFVCQDTYAAEAHLERLSMRAGFYDQQHSERHIPHVRETVGEVRNDD